MDAKFADVGLQSFATGQFHADTNYVVPHAENTQAVDVIDQGWWGPTPAAAVRQCPQANESNTWCHCVIIGNASGTKLSVPYNWTTADGPKGALSAGNNGATIMLNSTHAVQMQVCVSCIRSALCACQNKSWIFVVCFRSQKRSVTHHSGQNFDTIQIHTKPVLPHAPHFPAHTTTPSNTRPPPHILSPAALPLSPWQPFASALVSVDAEPPLGT